MRLSYLVSKRIREIIKQKHYTQYRLEMLAGMSHSTMNCLLNNRYESVNLKTLFIIIQALDMSVIEFFDSPLFDLEDIDLE